MKKIMILFITTLLSQLFNLGCTKDDEVLELTSVVKDDAELNLISSGFEFAEGPAYFSNKLYFSVTKHKKTTASTNK